MAYLCVPHAEKRGWWGNATAHVVSRTLVEGLARQSTLRRPARLVKVVLEHPFQTVPRGVERGVDPAEETAHEARRGIVAGKETAHETDLCVLRVK